MKSDIAQIRLALNGDPSNHSLRMALAKLLIDDAWSEYAEDKWIENYKEARIIYQSVLTACPKNAVALVNLGAVLSDQGYHTQAMQQYSLAQDLGWEDANLEFNIGVALISLRDHQRGIERLKASDTGTKHAETWQAYFDPQAH